MTSRRGFVQALLASGAAALLRACGLGDRPVAPTAAPATRLVTDAPRGAPPPAVTPTPGPTPTLAFPFAVVRRSEWGARAPNFSASEERGLFDAQRNPNGWLVYPGPLRDWLTTIVVHHSALALTDGAREIQNLHMDTRGWADIGYHFLLGWDGAIYEGRDLRVRGRHVRDANTGTVGVCLIGNFEQIAQPPSAQRSALERVVAYLAETYAMGYIAGHKDFNSETVCPGAHLYELVDALAASYGLIHSTAGYRVPPWVATPGG
jgi:hypothetical protein